MSDKERDPGRVAEGRVVAAMMLGTILGTVAKDDYPIKIRDSEEWVDADDQIVGITFITESGLRLKVHVEHEGEEPT